MIEESDYDLVLVFTLIVVVRLSVHVHINQGLSPRDSSWPTSAGLLQKSDVFIAIGWAVLTKRFLTECGVIPQSAQTLGRLSFLILLL